MKKGKTCVEQVIKTEVGVEFIEDTDFSLSPVEIFDRIKTYFPDIHYEDISGRLIIGNHKGHRFAIRCKNITYLGNPHPAYKKRIQISGDLFDFAQKASLADAAPLLMGIYSYRDTLLFTEFHIDTYLKKKAHNSSAHVYTEDLAAALEDGFFQKMDYFDNQITVFRPDAVSAFLDDYFGLDQNTVKMNNDVQQHLKISMPSKPDASLPKTSLEISRSDKKTQATRVQTYQNTMKDHIAPCILEFFEKENRNWNGIECYTKMIKDNYHNKFQPEWVGFFLEYEFENYIKSNHLENQITYAQDKKKGGIDLDIYFPEIKCYGDLKAHSSHSNAVQGNDWATVMGIIDQKTPSSHIYYIVCEHTTEKDSDYQYEVTQFWNKAQNKKDLMSYHKRMKRHVNLTKVYILDINSENKQYLSVFKQGLNSNGKPREPKIMIEQSNFSHFVIAEKNL